MNGWKLRRPSHILHHYRKIESIHEWVETGSVAQISGPCTIESIHEWVETDSRKGTNLTHHRIESIHEWVKTGMPAVYRALPLPD